MDVKDAEIARLRNELEKAQQEVDEVLESTKDIEAQLEQDLSQAEKELDGVKRKNDELKYDVQEWKERFAKAQVQHDKELSAAQTELSNLRQTYDKLRKDLRDGELRHDDLERQERIVTTSYHDLERKYHDLLEQNADLECQVTENKNLEVDCQRLKDEVRDLTAELTVYQLQRTSIKPLGEISKEDSRQTLASPPGPGVKNDKETHFVKTPERTGPAISPGRSGIPLPPSRLANSKSVRNLQTLSTTITALREKMKAAREVPAMNRPLSARSGRSDGQASIPGLGANIDFDGQGSLKVSAPASLLSQSTPRAPGYSSRRQSGIPTPDRPRTTTIKSPSIGRTPNIQRSQARQSLSSSMSEHTSPEKYSALAGNRSNIRRRSALPPNTTSGYPQSTAHSLSYAQKGEIKRPAKVT